MEGALRVAGHRMQYRFREAIRAVIAQTVSTTEEAEGELNALLAAYS
jgi:hypothetical protein